MFSPSSILCAPEAFPAHVLAASTAYRTWMSMDGISNSSTSSTTSTAFSESRSAHAKKGMLHV